MADVPVTDRQGNPCNPHPVEPIVSDSLVTSQATVDTSGASLIVAARVGRKGLVITQTGAGTDIYYGSASGVTTGRGDIIPGVKGANVSLPYTGAVYGVVATGSAIVSVVEVF